MWKYVRLLRLQDQYTCFGGALAAGLYLGIRENWIIWWAFSCTCISIGAFILNELVDRTDVDKQSWNPIHITQPIDIRIGWGLFIVFTFTGLLLSWQTSMFAWAMLMAVWYGLYSLPPIRLKARFGLDIATQIGAGWVIPFGIPIMLHQNDWLIILTTCLLGWSFVFPYQLADFTADKHAGFRCTHVVLGIRKSLFLGVLCACTGIILFVAGGGLTKVPWLIFMPLLAMAPIYLTFARWLKIHSIKKQEFALRHYVRWMKPVSQSLLPYVIILWFVW